MAVYDPVKSFLEKTFHSAKESIQSQETATSDGKPLSSYFVTLSNDSIYEPFILSTLNYLKFIGKEVYNLLLIDEIIKDVQNIKTLTASSIQRNCFLFTKTSSIAFII